MNCRIDTIFCAILSRLPLFYCSTGSDWSWERKMAASNRNQLSCLLSLFSLYYLKMLALIPAIRRRQTNRPTPYCLIFFFFLSVLYCPLLTKLMARKWLGKAKKVGMGCTSSRYVETVKYSSRRRPSAGRPTSHNQRLDFFLFIFFSIVFVFIDWPSDGFTVSFFFSWQKKTAAEGEKMK